MQTKSHQREIKILQEHDVRAIKALIYQILDWGVMFLDGNVSIFNYFVQCVKLIPCIPFFFIPLRITYRYDKTTRLEISQWERGAICISKLRLVKQLIFYHPRAQWVALSVQICAVAPVNSRLAKGDIYSVSI